MNESIANFTGAMSIDRGRLKKLQFLSSCPNENSHARIPNDFTTRIGNVDALIVYAVLRSKPWTHRWNTEWVKKELKDCGLKMGKGRVERAMAHLNKSGWITYVVLKNERGEKQGSIVQVHVIQLPLELRCKERVIQYSRGGSYKIYDFDGRTELSVKEFNAGWSAPKKGSERAHGGPGQLKDEAPLPRDPEDWVSGDQYKGDPKGEPHTPSGEGASLVVPLEEELGPGPHGPGPGEELLNKTSLPGGCSDGGRKGVAFSRGSVVPAIDWDDVRSMALRSRESEECRAAYHKLLVEVVFPALKDPPKRTKRWSEDESIEWCRSSVKGQFILSCAIEEEWPPDLAKAFRRSPSNCSISDIRLLLRTGVFASNPRSELKQLIPNSQDPERGQAWKKMKEEAHARDEHPRKVMEDRIRNLPSRENLTQQIEHCAKNCIGMAKEDCFQPPALECEDEDVFFGMLCAHFRSLDGAMGSYVQSWIEENRNDLARRMARFVASDRIGAAVALMDEIPARRIWRFDWEDVKKAHVEIASELAKGAELYGIGQSVTPDLELFAYERDLDPATKADLLELARERIERQ